MALLGAFGYGGGRMPYDNMMLHPAIHSRAALPGAFPPRP
jgi:hypothetical protein